MFFALAAVYGTCLGIIVPLLNSVIFIASKPDMRGLNNNLMLFTNDMSFFVGPYLGGMILALHLGFYVLFGTCAFLSLISVLFIRTFPETDGEAIDYS